MMPLDIHGNFKMCGWKALGFESYQDYLNSYLWQEKKNYLIEKKCACEICGSKNSLLVHHKSYFNVGNEDSRDIQVLCKDCHNKIGEEGDGE
jgi:5-methylcytosine-specific restriction endonuclease McrA